MILHNGWKKMIVNKHIANIELDRKRKTSIPNKEYLVSIPDAILFEDLETVFKNSKGYKNLYLRIFEDISKFKIKESSSVTDSTRGKAKYADIFLYEHLYRTYLHMFYMVKADRNLDIQRDIYLLIALLHDIGKSHSLCKHYKISLDLTHDIRSAKYFQKLLEMDILNTFNIEETSYNIIFNTLNNHHQLIHGEKTIHHQMLVKADTAARDEESQILERRKSKV